MNSGAETPVRGRTFWTGDALQCRPVPVWLRRRLERQARRPNRKTQENAATQTASRRFDFVDPGALNRLSPVARSGLGVLAVGGMLAIRMHVLDMGMLDIDVLAVLENMLLRRVIGMANRMQLVAMGKMSVVARFCVIALFGIAGRVAVVSRCMFEVRGGFVMVLMDLVFFLHLDSPEQVVGRLMPGDMDSRIKRVNQT
jgi:hypothetical protein